jgi:protein-disulfide isomerase
MNENNPSKFRWKLWLPIIAVVIVIVVAVVIVANRSPKVAYPDINSPRPTIGNLNAKVVLQEYSDFECPACGVAFPVVENLISQYGKDFRFEFKQFPLVNIHKDAYNAALASECANDQNKFWEYYRTLYQNQTKLSLTDLKKYAADLKLDGTKFDACLDSRAKKKVVDADVQDGKNKNVDGTPSFFLNGQKLEIQSFADLEAALKVAITGVQQGPVK